MDIVTIHLYISWSLLCRRLRQRLNLAGEVNHETSPYSCYHLTVRGDPLIAGNGHLLWLYPARGTQRFDYTSEYDLAAYFLESLGCYQLREDRPIRLPKSV